MWLVMALLSAFFAGLTAILAKCGIRKTDSDLATALRTIVVLAFSWTMVFMVGSAQTIVQIQPKSLAFLILSGLTTGASWICYFKALFVGDVNQVVPIDKSSTILTVLLAIILFGETNHLAIKLAGTALLATGIFLMTGREPANSQRVKTQILKQHQSPKKQRWRVYAIGSAVFAALTAILAKVGITGVESNLGTAIRTGVVLIMAWLIVFLKGKQASLENIDKRELLFIILSGFATGASWLCYYYAIQNGVVSVVVPIDKMSILVSIAFSFLVFHEKLSKKAAWGLALMVFSTIAMAIWS
ncbi:EamA family transporter [Lancefieldella sp. Marseille-Q7238]|uniref:EamA family transporter n=1 Tax=Lancefieldella sp. Marseille-Q7238 TaxID=3022127 RepID=UPI0024A9C19F|nr:EamA family transporter [Lancefieldella sp. Marseille-Q7238]